MMQQGRALTFSQVQQWGLTGGVIARLLLASLLGGLVGLDREYRRKASGVRTNLLICLGCALFTYLSAVVAGEGSTNKGQIASNIVQGIGFLGAGLILHNRNRVSGLTSAATVFAVAAVGMACGAGLYVPAIFATVIVLLVLEAVGALEQRFNLKLHTRIYEVRGTDAAALSAGVLTAMDEEKRRLDAPEHDVVGPYQRISFTVLTRESEHNRLLAALKKQPAAMEVLSFHSWEED